MSECPLFVELCAGTAALSLRLHHPRARPPVSRMGAKTGYADVILRCMGLRPGGRAARYLWCEPDAGVRLLLHAYTDRALATKASEIIRGWKDEAPRALWERLRAEGPAVCPPVDAREVARWAWVQRRSAHGKGDGFHGGNDTHKIDGDAPTAAILALPTIPATIADDARKVDPREVARWLFVVGGSMMGAGAAPFGGNLEGWQGTAHGQGSKRPLLARLPDALDATVTLPATIDPPQLPPGTVVYADVPYRGTTSYAHAFPRSEWLPVVRRWRDAGAMVVVSEAEPIPDLMAEGWHAVEITGERKGQKRTFSKQQHEWLTMSEPPKWRPSVQQGLFG